MSGPRLGERLDAMVGEERRHAVRALLRRPFITADGSHAEVFTLVRRHRDVLAEWFQSELGYRLVVESDFARLHKLPPPVPLAHRRLDTRAGQPFDARRYVLFCLVLAALEQMGDQTTLDQLAEAVKLHAVEIDGFEVDFDRVADRRAFTHAVRAVVDLGVLDLRDGDEERFARKEEGGDALYQVRHRRMARVLSAPVPPSSAEEPDRIGVEPYPETSEGRTRRSRHRVMRLLVEEPVCYFEELDEEDRAYLMSQRGRISRQLEAFCGFEVELRAEGIATIDATGETSDLLFPSEGTVAHAALLLAEELGRRARASAGGDVTMTLAEIETYTGMLAERYGRYWRADLISDPQARRQLAELALERLEAFRLIRRVDAGVRVCPAVARFAAAPVQPPGVEAG